MSLASRATGLLTDRLTRSAIGVLLTFMVTLGYLLSSVLDIPITHRPDQVSVQLPRTGGLYEGSPASYRGVRVGTVEALRVDPDGGVIATIRLRDGAKVPRDTAATVRSLSPVGEQYLDFRPDSADGPYLSDGDVVEGTATDVPVSVAQAVASLDNVVSRVDQDDLRTVLKETSLAVSGTGDDLERLLTATDDLSTSLDEHWPQTRQLLESGREVGEVLAAHRDDLRRFSGSAVRLASFLRDFNPEFRQILARAPGDFRTVGLLIDDLGTILPRFLDTLVRGTDIAYDREPQLRRTLEELPYGTRSFANAFDNGWLRVNLYLVGQAQCTYEGQEPGDPTSVEREPLYLDGRCSGTGAPWRGAAHAPGPINR
ncbi:MAG: MCE family protein [Actinobacteria bacterium]|uniref:Unannotated protein n=1 Tax=freshwater metagenome TaxID=449393 RepID=A0A6J6RRV3_9ZZZZ|nr:MCE family protein [Actinomycetota bacterium]